MSQWLRYHAPVIVILSKVGNKGSPLFCWVLWRFVLLHAQTCWFFSYKYFPKPANFMLWFPLPGRPYFVEIFLWQRLTILCIEQKKAITKHKITDVPYICLCRGACHSSHRCFGVLVLSLKNIFIVLCISLIRPTSRVPQGPRSIISKYLWLLYSIIYT